MEIKQKDFKQLCKASDMLVDFIDTHNEKTADPDNEELKIWKKFDKGITLLLNTLHKYRKEG